jgi:hypothetical protein
MHRFIAFHVLRLLAVVCMRTQRFYSLAIIPLVQTPVLTRAVQPPIIHRLDLGALAQFETAKASAWLKTCV